MLPLAFQVGIIKPIFVINLPRTGSTLLGRLLSCDDQLMTPKAWEVEETDNLKDRQIPNNMVTSMREYH